MSKNAEKTVAQVLGAVRKEGVQEGAQEVLTTLADWVFDQVYSYAGENGVKSLRRRFTARLKEVTEDKDAGAPPMPGAPPVAAEETRGEADPESTEEEGRPEWLNKSDNG